MRKGIGYFLSISFLCCLWGIIPESAIADGRDKSLSVFPILMYDSNIGFGYGAKAKFVQYLAKKESFDVIVFNSTKGERWYVFTFSIPDVEIRQQQKYALSFDIKAEYDKYLKYYFFGVGKASRESDRTEFAFEKKELQLRAGRGLTSHFIIEAHYVLKNVAYLSVEEGKPFTDILREVGHQFSPFMAFFIRHDTSDSQIHPQAGHRFIFQNDVAARFLGNAETRFHRMTLDCRKYFSLFGHKDVMAFRVLVQKISGSNIPLYELSSLGGGSEMAVLRGYRLNRFQDKGKFLAMAEYRFPLWRRLGATVFMEGGSVWPSWSRIDFEKAVVDIGFGLRYYLRNFVVRFDTGISREGIGLYFNFGHVF